MTYLEFEKPLADLEGKAEELRVLARKGEGVDLEKEAAALDKKAGDMLRDLYRQLDPWRKTQVARHPDARIAATMSRRSSPNTRPWPATAPLARITPSWAAWRGSATRPAW